MWQSVRVPFLTILFALLSLFIFTKIFGPIPFTVNSINTNKETLFTVSASAEVTGIPDTAVVNLGVIKQALTAEAAKEQVNKIINQITSDLKRLGVEEKDIKTTEYSVNPEYDFGDNGEDRINGVSVSANVQARIKSIEKANQAVDAATKAGANRAGGIQFVLDDEARSKLENQARQVAIGEAKEKAKSIAQAAGIKLGRIIDVQESDTGGEPIPYYSKTMALDAEQKTSEPTQLNPGENTITSNVYLSFETF